MPSDGESTHAARGDRTAIRRIATLLLLVRQRASDEIGLLVGLMLAAGGLWLFLAVADEVFEDEPDGRLHGLDQAILLGLRTADTHDPIGPAWLEIAARDLTGLGSITVLVVVVLVAGGSLLALRRTAAACLLVVSVAGGMLLSDLLKGYFGRPRPDLVSHVVDVTDLSFPSGHAMLSATTYLTLAAVLVSIPMRLSLKLFLLGAAIILTLLIGLSRIYLGVHWPSDVVAGWCIGSAWALSCWVVSEIVQRYRQRPEPA